MNWLTNLIERGLSTHYTSFGDPFQGFRRYCNNEEKETAYEVTFEEPDGRATRAVLARCTGCGVECRVEIKVVTQGEYW